MEIYQRTLDVLPSVCDSEGRLSHGDVFAAFMDVASAHADALGIGLKGMAARGLFWLTVKTKVQFFSRPAMGEQVTLRTWPEAPETMRGNRSYALLRGEELLAAGKTEWAVISTETGRLTPMKGIYPEGLRFETPSACPVPFARVPGGFAGEAYARYTIRSTDIDVGGHMNNTAYVRALMGSFSTGERQTMAVGCMDVIFRAPCYEGDELIFFRQAREGGTDVKVTRGNDTVLLARIE